MATTAYFLASGHGWRVDDVICTAGPHAPRFEERHAALCVAVVTEGTFQYRSSQGEAVLTPGSLLLGNPGQCFECGHDHGIGDRCLSFHFSPDYFEAIVAAVPGAKTMRFVEPRLPPSLALSPLVADAEAAREDCDGEELEELALRFAGAVAATQAETPRAAALLRPHHGRRISEAVRRIAAEACEPPSDDGLSLAKLARQAAMSPFHFLRAFSRIVGMTPHQFLLRTRLHRAALLLRRSDDCVSDIAFATGFNDLSTFNRRFRRIMGMSPSAYRGR